MSRTQDSESHDDPQRAGNPNLDPDPVQDQDLEPGGGVIPGHTPPDSNSATSSPPGDADRRRPPAAVVIIGLAALVLLMALVFVAYGVGLFV